MQYESRSGRVVSRDSGRDLPAEHPPSGSQTTLAERAFGGIYQLIMSGDLSLGAVVNEVGLSQKLDIGRGPIREAIRRLQGLKLVTREPYLRARVVSLSNSDIVEIFELRESVEGMACRLAATSMNDEALERLLADFGKSQGTGRLVTPHSAPFDLHVAIAENCGNSRIRALLCEELYHLLRLYRMRSGSKPGRHANAAEEHWQIMRALQLRDPELAESLMRSHIQSAMRVLTESNDK